MPKMRMKNSHFHTSIFQWGVFFSHYQVAKKQTKIKLPIFFEMLCSLTQQTASDIPEEWQFVLTEGHICHAFALGCWLTAERKDDTVHSAQDLPDRVLRHLETTHTLPPFLDCVPPLLADFPNRGALIQKLLQILLFIPASQGQDVCSESHGIAIACLLERYFGSLDSVILRGLDYGNSALFLGADMKQELVVLKQHTHPKRWYLENHVVDELYAQFFFNMQPRTRKFPQLLQMSVQANLTTIVTEYIPLSCKDLFSSGTQFKFLQTRFKELLKVLRRLHNNHFAHRDIKPENVRFRANGRLVLIDFDTCVLRDNHQFFTRQNCTLTTRPPELCLPTSSQRAYSGFQCDVFSAGCLMVAMANDCWMPFSIESDEKRRESIRQGWVPGHRIQQRLGSHGVDMIQQMLRFDPAERPTVDQLLQHPFFLQ